ncbi:MAG: hypothetical protein KatS3mg124_1078 [Porticoccaceae bacterium]|nr:MAG: hypothetical protein KatS3mg124_1078 [Porticoccaceae bacterium]
MPHKRLEDLADGAERWPTVGGGGFRSEQWGDMEVGYTVVRHPLDCTELYRLGGLPGGVCPCPHYGFLFEGRMRARYPGSDWPDEVIEAGEAFFIPAGHVLLYEAPSRVFELNPAHALQSCMAAMERAARSGRLSGRS